MKKIPNDYISRRAVIDALVRKGQATTRYEVNEEWELNCQEICEAISEIPGIEDSCSYAQGWKDGRKKLFDDMQELL